MLAFVIDASATLPWCFASEATQATNNLLTRLMTNDEAIVPAHWYFEVSNALLVAIRRGRISPPDAMAFLYDLTSLPIQIEPTTETHLRNDVFSLASSSISPFTTRHTWSWREGRLCLWQHSMRI